MFLKVRTRVFTLNKQNLKLLQLLYSFSCYRIFVNVCKEKQLQGKDWKVMFHLRRPLESQDLKSAYFTQLNLQKIIRVHVLRAGLPITLYANKNATDITKQGFWRFWYLKVEATCRTPWFESADPKGENLPKFLLEELQNEPITSRCVRLSRALTWKASHKAHRSHWGFVTSLIKEHCLSSVYRP